MTDYTPVDCGLHSAYELAIIRRQPVRLSWQDSESATHTETVLPTDLLTRNGEEFMRVSRAQGERIDIRLDCIRQLHPAR